MAVSTIRPYAVTFVALMTLTGCGGEPNHKSVTFNPNIDVFSGQPDGGGFSARTLTCTKEIDGQCMQKTCTKSRCDLSRSVPFSWVRLCCDSPPRALIRSI